MTLTYQNCIYEQINSRLHTEISCYHLVPTLLHSSLLFKLLKMYFTCCFVRALNLVFYTKGRAKLGAFENRVLRIILVAKREKVSGSSRRLLYKELHKLYASTNFIRVIKSERMR